MPAPNEDQVAGSLLGLALGDALGAVVEARPPAEARRYVDEVLRRGAAGSVGRGSEPFGQVTDDTQLVRELLLSLHERGGFEPAHFAARLSTFVMAGRLVGGGPASRHAARALRDGVPWQGAGVPAPYAGNGAAMRAGPLGVLLGHDPRRLTEVARDQARVTHQDPRTWAGALAVAGAAAIAARREPVVPGAVLAELARLVEPLDAGVAGAIAGMRDWAALDPEEAARHLHARRLEPGSRGAWRGISSFVTSSVCWSLYADLRAPDSWWEAVCLAIRVGGDTDTLAAMTGSIAGARHGLAALPAALVARLRDGTHWDAASLVRLAADCHRLQDRLA